MASLGKAADGVICDWLQIGKARRRVHRLGEGRVG